MKWIVAIIQSHRLEAVREALVDLNIDGLTVTEVKGFGRQKGHTEVYRGAEYRINYVPKLKLEIAVDGEQTERTVSAIASAAQTGKIGDGKIFVIDLESAMRIRTGETGAASL